MIFLYYDETTSGCIKDYYYYIIEIINNIINDKKDMSDDKILIIVIGDQNTINIHDIDTYNKIIKISINYEHTLVKKGGRDSFNFPIGNIKTIEGDRYLVRIDKYFQHIQSDIIIDYSIPNIKNISESGLFNEYSSKVIYIAPVLYSEKYEKKYREINCLTTFINTKEPRRRKLLDNIEKINMSHNNVNNCFEKDKLEDLYLRTKVMINIHQTEHHHTFEELRVLPALLCGIIVICEDSPLKEYIPYNEFVIWTTYDKIIDQTTEVLNNYDFYYNKIFGNIDALNKVIFCLKQNNHNILKTMIYNK